MTNKDVLKVLLCSYGYDRNIKIDTYRGEGGWLVYDVYAENKEGSFYHETDSEGFMFHVYEILYYMNKNSVPFKSRWWGSTLKEVCNDETRAALTMDWDKEDAKISDFIEITKPLDEWRKAHNPCPTCSINKKDHWDSVHYNCELMHDHSCTIMLEFNSKYQEYKNEFMKTVPNYDKQNK